MADIEHATIVGTGGEFIDTVYWRIEIAFKAIAEMVGLLGIGDRWLRHNAPLDDFTLLQVGNPLEVTLIIGISDSIFSWFYLECGG